MHGAGHHDLAREGTMNQYSTTRKGYPKSFIRDMNAKKSKQEPKETLGGVEEHELDAKSTSGIGIRRVKDHQRKAIARSKGTRAKYQEYFRGKKTRR